MDRTVLGSVLFAILVVTGMAVPAMALSTAGDEPPTSGLAAVSTQPDVATHAQTASPTHGQPENRITPKVGPQLSTVIGVSSDEVQTGVDTTAFERSVERGDDDTRAEAIAARAEALRDRADAIRDDYEAATEAYEAGELTTDEYAQRLAVLNARATNVRTSYAHLRQRALSVPEADRRAANVSDAALNRSLENLSTVTGAGMSALLRQFTGEAEGEIDLEFANGLSIEVESEDGERYREFERPGDGSDSLLLTQARALETARDALSTADTAGEWVLVESEIDEDDGVYEFAFVLRNVSTLSGEAAVAVDGSSGTVVSLDEAIERRGEDDEDDSDEDDESELDDAEDADDADADSDRELTILVTDGTPGPNERITIQVRANGAPLEGVTVSVNDRAVGQTDADGRLTLTLPATERVEITAETDDAEAELEFEFEVDFEDDDSEDEAEDTETPVEDDEADEDD